MSIIYKTLWTKKKKLKKKIIIKKNKKQLFKKKLKKPHAHTKQRKTDIVRFYIPESQIAG